MERPPVGSGDSGCLSDYWGAPVGQVVFRLVPARGRSGCGYEFVAVDQKGLRPIMIRARNLEEGDKGERRKEGGTAYRMPNSPRIDQLRLHWLQRVHRRAAATTQRGCACCVGACRTSTWQAKRRRRSAEVHAPAIGRCRSECRREPRRRGVKEARAP